MLKKIIIASAVVVIVCLIASAVLFPIAVNDSIKMSAQNGAVYSSPVPLLDHLADGVASVRLANGWAHRMEVRPSTDGRIRLYTDGYNINPPVVTATLSDSGDLQLYFSRYSATPNFNLSRDMLRRGVIATLNRRSTDSYVLEVPRDVAFNTTRENGRVYNNLVIHPGVKAVDASLPPYGERGRASAAEIAPGAADRDTRRSDELYEERFDDLYDLVGRGALDEAGFWDRAEPLIEGFVGHLTGISVNDSPEASEYVRRLAEIQLVDELEEYNDRLYQRGDIDSLTYYEQDLLYAQRMLELATLAADARDSLMDWDARLVSRVDEVF